jgi:hypothetical protein
MSEYKFMNEIFYKNKVFNDSTEIKSLETFFYDSSKGGLQSLSIKTPPIQEVTTVHEGRPSIKKDTKEIVKNGNSIFWSIYIDIYGYSDYMMIGNKYSNHELQEKQKIISYLKSNPYLFKTTNNKITKIQIQEIYSEFMSLQNSTSLLGVVGLSLYYKTRIILVDKEKNIYYDIHNENDERTITLVKNNRFHNKQKYELANDTDISSMLKMESIKKTLKSISSYKQSELKTIYETYVKGSAEHLKKQEIYNSILQHCGEFLPVKN